RRAAPSLLLWRNALRCALLIAPYESRCLLSPPMTFPDLVASLKSALPHLRGRLLGNEPLAPLTWFRVGGVAQALFMPEDEADLADLLANLPREIPVTAIGLGSNLIVRDGGVQGVVIRLGRGFNEF